ncbi:hypothetical protein JT06_15235 [Desulfobulbus sp. Tol-SR]|jgi:hypothetical protein|nr:hypothetical protein JT06_15235 [Desulfobulbus sp. Tol-SR]
MRGGRGFTEWQLHGGVHHHADSGNRDKGEDTHDKSPENRGLDSEKGEKSPPSTPWRIQNRPLTTRMTPAIEVDLSMRSISCSSGSGDSLRMKWMRAFISIGKKLTTMRRIRNRRAKLIWGSPCEYSSEATTDIRRLRLTVPAGGLLLFHYVLPAIARYVSF